MAFAGTFSSHIRKVIHGKSNLTTSAKQLPRLLIDDDIIIISSSSNSSSDSVGGDSFASQPTHGTRNEYSEANYRGVLDSDLTSLTTAQKDIFIVILTVLFGLSFCGNVCTLFVNFRRKIRPFFRACLISLAFSDLMNTVFLTACYLSQFTADFVQIWSLGNVMCSLVPFATTCAILASSMTLVGIALDRYFAVMKAVIGFWNPSVISCIACMLCIWLASISIACPAFTFYNRIPVYILTQVHGTANATTGSQIITAATAAAAAMNATALPLLPTKIYAAKLMTSSVTTMKSVMPGGSANRELATSLENLSYILVRKRKLVNMCVSDQENVSVYYVVVFTIIFLPCIVAFFWFNIVIARQLWERRHLAAAARQRNLTTKNNSGPPSSMASTQTERPKCALIQNKTCKSKQISSSTTAPSNVSCATNTHSAGANHSREARHLRMFTIILLMMAIFVFLRLPAWIFLVMRMYGNYTAPRYWILYFSFGLMNLTSSVLNPLCYTFLAATLKCITKLKSQVASLRCSRCSLSSCWCRNNLADGRCNSLLCWQQSTATIPDRKYIAQTHSLESEVHSKDSMPAINNEKDEGVDCNDEVDEEHVCSIQDYSQQIYTIFPSSLVSSSTCEEN